jgi:hypothetical protein
MQKTCEACGRDYETSRSNSLTCSATCRSRKRSGIRAGAKPESDLVKAVRAELESAGKLNTRHGQQALVLAAQMSTGTGVGTLSKELDRVMASALGVQLAGATPAASTGDSVDELRARRDAKRAG